MKLYGSLDEIKSLSFSKDGYLLVVEPTTSALQDSRVFRLPGSDELPVYTDFLVTQHSIGFFENKSIVLENSINPTGSGNILSGIYDEHISGSAAIQFVKLEDASPGQLLVASAGPTNPNKMQPVTLSKDATLAANGELTLTPNNIVNEDINSDAQINYNKLADLGNPLKVLVSNVNEKVSTSNVTTEELSELATANINLQRLATISRSIGGAADSSLQKINVLVNLANNVLANNRLVEFGNIPTAGAGILLDNNGIDKATLVETDTIVPDIVGTNIAFYVKSNGIQINGLDTSTPLSRFGGGTGVNAATPGSLFVWPPSGSISDSLAQVSPGAAGHFLATNAAGTAPEYTDTMEATLKLGADLTVVNPGPDFNFGHSTPGKTANLFCNTANQTINLGTLSGTGTNTINIGTDNKTSLTLRGTDISLRGTGVVEVGSTGNALVLTSTPYNPINGTGGTYASGFISGNFVGPKLLWGAQASFSLSQSLVFTVGENVGLGDVITPGSAGADVVFPSYGEGIPYRVITSLDTDTVTTDMIAPLNPSQLVTTDATGKVVSTSLGDENDVTHFGNLTVNGDLTVSGTQTFVNTTNLEVTDKNILVNKGGTGGTAVGAGLSVEENENAIATIEYDPDSDSGWKLTAFPGTPTQVDTQIVGETTTQELTNKTYISPVLEFTNATLDKASIDLEGTPPVAHDTVVTGLAAKTYVDNALKKSVQVTTGGTPLQMVGFTQYFVQGVNAVLNLPVLTLGDAGTWIEIIDADGAFGGVSPSEVRGNIRNVTYDGTVGNEFILDVSWAYLKFTWTGTTWVYR